MNAELDAPPRALIPADVEAPDKLLYGMTARQLAVLAVAAVLAYGLWRVLGPVLPGPVVAGLLLPLAGTAAAVALGRRDGLGLDAWLWAALRHTRSSKRLASPAPASPVWAPVSVTGPDPACGVLRLPAEAVSGSGVVRLGSGAAVALVAVGTVNIGLRTGSEQQALLDAYARWLNAVTGPVQVVVSAQRADLTGYALRTADSAQRITAPALADAAADYADFLLEIAAQRDPLWRTVTIACVAEGAAADGEALRRAGHTAAALAGLGVRTRVLDGPTATAVLTVAVDPYQHTDASWPRTPPDVPIRLEARSRP